MEKNLREYKTNNEYEADAATDSIDDLLSALAPLSK